MALDVASRFRPVPEAEDIGSRMQASHHYFAKLRYERILYSHDTVLLADFIRRIKDDIEHEVHAERRVAEREMLRAICDRYSIGGVVDLS